MAKPLHEVVEAGWARALEPVAPVIADMGEFLRAETAAGRRYLPAGANILRAFLLVFEQTGFWEKSDLLHAGIGMASFGIILAPLWWIATKRER